MSNADADKSTEDQAKSWKTRTILWGSLFAVGAGAVGYYIATRPTR